MNLAFAEQRRHHSERDPHVAGRWVSDVVLGAQDGVVIRRKSASASLRCSTDWGASLALTCKGWNGTAAKAKTKRSTKMLTVGDVMTSQPFTIGRNQTLAIAHRMMADHRIRHLPVLERGERVGVVSERDLFFLETVASIDKHADKVEDAMTVDIRAFAPETPLFDVAGAMFKYRLGCAVVVERDRVVGIFTAMDALRILAQGTRA